MSGIILSTLYVVTLLSLIVSSPVSIIIFSILQRRKMRRWVVQAPGMVSSLAQCCHQTRSFLSLGSAVFTVSIFSLISTNLVIAK